MNEVALGAAVALVTAVAMEPWAMLVHRLAWHQWLWRVHRSHHEPRRGRFEANDSLSVLHAPIAITLIVSGCQLASPLRPCLVGMGVGMTLFGLAYVLVHDGLIHERLPLRWLLRWRVLRRIRGAHIVHHRSGGAPYG